MGKKDDFNLKKRKKAFRLEKKSFLILCEGKNTEKIYFESFRLVTAYIHAEKVNHGNSLTFVEECLRFKEKLRKKYDEYWIVLDKDDNTNEIFNSAVQLAKQKQFQVAYSNQSFEFWYLLHFTFRTGSIDRTKYKDLLTKHLEFNYEKDEKTCKRISTILQDKNKTELAIENAKKVYATFTEPRNPAEEESSTTVHLLVQELLRYLL